MFKDSPAHKHGGSTRDLALEKALPTPALDASIQNLQLVNHPPVPSPVFTRRTSMGYIGYIVRTHKPVEKFCRFP